MKTKRAYINPKVVEGTMDVLQRYKEQHPQDNTPLINACAHEPSSERPRFVRAAQRLGWNVTRTQGKIYENGVLAWEA